MMPLIDFVGLVKQLSRYARRALSAMRGGDKRELLGAADGRE
jgi:hypothetical protein